METFTTFSFITYCNCINDMHVLLCLQGVNINELIIPAEFRGH